MRALYVCKYSLDYSDHWPFEIMVWCGYSVEANGLLFSILHFWVSSCKYVMLFTKNIRDGFWLISALSALGNFRLTRGYSLCHLLLLQRLMNIWLDEMMEESMEQVVLRVEAPLRTGKANRRREGALAGETARDYGRRMTQTWTTKMTTNSSIM